MLPLDPFNRTRLPGDLTRSDRVRLLGEFAAAVIAGRQPSRESELFLASALRAWLEAGGSLERHHFRVVKAKSHFTPQVVWRRIQASSAMSDTATDRTDTDTTFWKD